MKHSLSSREIVSVLRVKPFFSDSLRVSFRAAHSQKIGFSLGRSLGPAVKRNRFKRKVRSIVLALQKNKKPFHLLVQPKKKIDKINNLKGELSSILNKIYRNESLKNG